MIKKYALDDLCINLLITSNCNAGCSFCIANEYMHSQNVPILMSEKSFNSFLPYVEKEKNSIEQINLLGGEPSLHPNALSFARQIDNLGVSVGFSTNGFWNKNFRRKVEKIGFPIEFEITYLGKENYHYSKYKEIKKTFDQLKGMDVSLGIIILSCDTSYHEHLEICEKYGFDLRWALLEPTPKIGLPQHYTSLQYLKKVGKLIEKMIKEANKRGIYTWADLTVPRCMFDDNQLELFKNELNDIQFFCPPFFDIATDLKIWRCLPLAEKNPPNLLEFYSLRDAYIFLDNTRKKYSQRGIFKECESCDLLGKDCSGGPTIAKKMKNEIGF